MQKIVSISSLTHYKYFLTSKLNIIKRKWLSRIYVLVWLKTQYLSFVIFIMIALPSLHLKTTLLILIQLSMKFSKFETFNCSSSLQLTISEHIKHTVKWFWGPKTFPVYPQIPEARKEVIVSEYKHVLSRLKWLNIATNSEIAPTGSFFISFLF